MNIVITGAARGIGAATARRLAAAGHHLALGDLDLDLVQGVADEISTSSIGGGAGSIGGGAGSIGGGAGSIGGGPGRAIAAHLDVTSPDSWRAFLEATADFGPIDVLVNNAGIMPLGPVLKEPDDVTRKIFDVNVFGIINGTKAVGPGMVDRGRGHIINVASAVGRVPVADGASYAASKFAAVGFSESTRLELKPHGIDVTVILPGIVRTELAAGVPDARGVKSLKPEDVAEVIESAIRKPRPELWVPTWTRSMAKATGILPLRVQEAIGRAFKADRVMSDADPVARAAYEERARRP